MTRAELKTEARYITKTNTSTYSDTDFDAGLELVRKRVFMKVLRATTEWNIQGEIARTDLISTTGLSEGDIGYNGEYPMPSGLIKLARVDISYDGTDFYKAKLYFTNDDDESEETSDEMDGMGKETEPSVKIFRDSLFIRPLPTTTVSDGIKLKYSKALAELYDDSTEIPEIPEFQEIYVYAMAVRFGTRYPRKMKAEWRRKYSEIENEMMKFYTNKFRRNLQIKTVDEDFS